MKSIVLLQSGLLIALFIGCGLKPAAKQTNSTEAKWNEKFDLDGDGIVDTITYSFSGGAHCCYLIQLTLSSNEARYEFPFEIDGGYVMFDLSQPDNFNIKDYDNDNLPEIFMKIGTYNGETSPIPTEWESTYGIKTNEILIDYWEKELRVIDVLP